MSFKKSISLMVASTVISTALSAIANAEGLEFGCTPLAVNMGSECLAETGLSGQAQISLGTIRQGSALNLYFSLAGSILGASGDNADDYEITFLSGTDPRRRFALNCTAVPSVEDGRLIVKLTVVHNNRSMTPSLIQTVSSDIPEVNSAEDFIRTALPQIIDRELEQDQITTNNIAVSAVDGQLIIRNRQTQETRTIHIYGTVN